MSEELMYRIMMVAGLVLAGIAGVATIGLVIQASVEFSIALAFGAACMALGTVGFGWSAVYAGRRVTGHNKVFENAAEREVLTPKQRHELRRARGSVVMNRALQEINDEQDKLINKALNPPEEVHQPEPYQQRQAQSRWDKEVQRRWDDDVRRER